ncbi:hypothetical protein BpHYR1_009516 [Brachionus plicatilis]|uniref:Uncharacterized protein n=1 Tax=Brachionus plicatilis TaxID=10195 RepID=A0A3M7SUE2_BRAPC|nr:hypothetical protein BpHYR1_009516 [Brachionus plicatilis]
MAKSVLKLFYQFSDISKFTLIVSIDFGINLAYLLFLFALNRAYWFYLNFLNSKFRVKIENSRKTGINFLNELKFYGKVTQIKAMSIEAVN